MPAPRIPPSNEGRRIIICDYHALLLSVTGLLRMCGYRVFQAYDADAVEELCAELPDIDLLILNTFGTGVDLPDLIQRVRARRPRLPVLHIGVDTPADLPADVPTIPEVFTPDHLLMAVAALMPEQPVTQGSTLFVAGGARPVTGGTEAIMRETESIFDPTGTIIEGAGAIMRGTGHMDVVEPVTDGAAHFAAPSVVTLSEAKGAYPKACPLRFAQGDDGGRSSPLTP